MIFQRHGIQVNNPPPCLQNTVLHFQQVIAINNYIWTAFYIDFWELRDREGELGKKRNIFYIWSLLTAIMLEDLSRSFSLNNISHVTIIKAKAKQHAYFGKKQWRLSRPLFPLGFYAIVWNNILIIFLRQVYFIYKWYFQTPNTISGDQ